MTRYEREVLVYLGDLPTCIEKNDNYFNIEVDYANIRMVDNYG